MNEYYIGARIEIASINEDGELVWNFGVVADTIGETIVRVIDTKLQCYREIHKSRLRLVD